MAKHVEYLIQSTLVSMLNHYYSDVLFFAIPNGGKREKREAARLKAMGVLAGVHDLFISEVTPIYSGLYLEMKTPTGVLSVPQKRFRDRAVARGYCCEVATSPLQGLSLVESYLGIPQHCRIVKP